MDMPSRSGRGWASASRAGSRPSRCSCRCCGRASTRALGSSELPASLPQSSTSGAHRRPLRAAHRGGRGRVRILVTRLAWAGLAIGRAGAAVMSIAAVRSPRMRRARLTARDGPPSWRWPLCSSGWRPWCRSSGIRWHWSPSSSRSAPGPGGGREDCGSSADGGRPRIARRCGPAGIARTFRKLVKFGLVRASASSSTSRSSRSACASSTCTPAGLRHRLLRRRLEQLLESRVDIPPARDSHVAMQGARFFAVSLLAATAGSCCSGLRARRPANPGRDARGHPGGRSLPRQQALVVPLRLCGRLLPWPRCSCSSRCPRSRTPMSPSGAPSRSPSRSPRLARSCSRTRVRASRRAARGRTGSCSRARRFRRRRSQAG